VNKLSRYLFVSLAIAVILISCGDKPTEPDNKDFRKQATINALVVDSNGTGIENAVVTIALHVFKSDILSLFNVHTESGGRRTFTIAVIDSNGADSVFAYASLHGIPPTSDTVRFIVEDGNPTYSLTFVIDP